MSVLLIVVLYQFLMFYYNEKVCWVFDWKGILYCWENYFFGLYVRVIEKLLGQSLMLVLVFGEDVISGLVVIFEWLEVDYFKLFFLLSDLLLCSEVFELQECFDCDVGLVMCMVFFLVFMNESVYVVKMFGFFQLVVCCFVYCMIFLLVCGKVQVVYQMNDLDYVVCCEQIVIVVFDEVVECSVVIGYFVGDLFMFVDFICVVLFVLIVGFDYFDMK